jgi:hypothetical protein
MKLTDPYPRNVSIYGTERFPSAIMSFGEAGTCGTLVFQAINGDEYYLYLNGTNPLTPMLGGVNEVMNNPAGGVALGPGVPKASVDVGQLLRDEGLSTFGSSRVSSSIMIASNPNAFSPAPPAIGFVIPGGFRYVYLQNRALYWGDQTAWLARALTNQIGAGQVTPSGALGPGRSGRSVIADDGKNSAYIPGMSYPAAVIRTGGKCGALILASGDHQAGVAMFWNGTTIKFDTVQNWLTYCNS